MKADIILVFGRICSGKGSFMNGHRIVVSDIVRSLVRSNARDQLQNTMDMDMAISDGILNELQTTLTSIDSGVLKREPIVVDGIRQSSIVQKIVEQYPDCDLVWLQVPTQKRRSRYESRKHEKDVESFDIADNKPIELECQKIYDNYKEQLQVIYNG